MRSQQTIKDDTFPHQEDIVDLSQLSPDAIHGENAEIIDEGDDSNFPDDYYDQSNVSDQDVLESNSNNSQTAEQWLQDKRQQNTQSALWKIICESKKKGNYHCKHAVT